jgi:hypothetical protein
LDIIAPLATTTAQSHALTARITTTCQRLRTAPSSSMSTFNHQALPSQSRTARFAPRTITVLKVQKRGTQIHVRQASFVQRVVVNHHCAHLAFTAEMLEASSCKKYVLTGTIARLELKLRIDASQARCASKDLPAKLLEA